MLRFATGREWILILLSVGALAVAVTGSVIGYRRLMTFGAQRVGVRRR